MVLSSTTEAHSQLRAQISGVMGSTSLACWIVLLMPQLIEQWRLKSAEGIAIGFITIWFCGDLFNLVGALWAHLLPEVVFLAVWFCVADALMIWSFVYYTRFYKKKQHHHHHGQHHHHHQEHLGHEHAVEHSAHSEHGQGEREYLDESAPLLHRRRSSTLTDIALEPQYHSIFVKYILPIIFVVACGIVGFLLSSPQPADPTDPIDPIQPPEDDIIALGPQIMGYCSAFLYLGARIPQIIQNYQRKSVYGLSLLFFLFSTLGNLTYAGQIIFYRSDWNYIVLNMSWLLGSLGTIVEDVIIFGQFYMYKDNDSIEDDEERV